MYRTTLSAYQHTITIYVRQVIIIGGEFAQWYNTHPLIQRSPVQFQAQSHTRVMDYDEAYIIHLTPGVVHNFSKAVDQDL